MMRGFMGGGSEGMILRTLTWDPRTAKELELSDAQVKEIKDAVASADKEMMELNGKLEQATKQQSELWKADTLDEDALMKAAGEASDISSQLAKMRVKQAITAFKVLTPEQRAKFHETLKQRMGQGPQREGIRQAGAFQGHGAGPAVPPVPKPSAPATAPATPPAAQ